MTHIAETFRALHVKGDPVLMVNVWDRGSAKMMQAMGAKALATSSAAHAFTMGRPDGGTVTRDEALAHAAEIISVVSVPVQGDFENGFGEDPETCAETVRLAAEVGLAGICIEDTALPAQTAYDFDLSVERIKAAADAARGLGHDFVLTARADGILTGAYDTDEAIRRLIPAAPGYGGTGPHMRWDDCPGECLGRRQLHGPEPRGLCQGWSWAAVVGVIFGADHASCHP